MHSRFFEIVADPPSLRCYFSSKFFILCDHHVSLQLKIFAEKHWSYLVEREGGSWERGDGGGEGWWWGGEIYGDKTLLIKTIYKFLRFFFFFFCISFSSTHLRNWKLKGWSSHLILNTRINVNCLKKKNKTTEMKRLTLIDRSMNEISYGSKVWNQLAFHIITVWWELLLANR